MGSRTFEFLMLLFLSSAAVLLCSQVAVAKAGGNVFTVPNDFPTIQEAINAAQNGSTIQVNSGIYHEHLAIDKTLMLLGQTKKETIIDGSNNGDVITITADNVLVEGFTIRNSSRGGVGLRLDNSTGSILAENVVTLNGLAGIILDESGNNTVSDNIVSSTFSSTIDLLSGDGISLVSSSNNIIINNVITESMVSGISLYSSYNNSMSGNVIENNGNGVSASYSDDNKIFHNDFIHNYRSSQIQDFSNNTWSIDGEGNYWDRYVGLDDGSGGRVAGDGIGDTNLPWNGVDNYPLINPTNPFSIFWENEAFPASLVSNSTVSAFAFDQTDKEIAFDVTGPANSTGHFTVSIPKALLSGSWTILLDGTDVTAKAAITENQTYTTIYLSYGHSTHNVQIIGTNVIPEYLAASTLLLILLTLPPPILVAKKRKKNQQMLAHEAQSTLLSSK